MKTVRTSIVLAHHHWPILLVINGIMLLTGYVPFLISLKTRR